MPQFSDRSILRLSECDPRLQNVFGEVIKHFDCIVLCGHRSQREQNAAYRAGTSKLRYPQSKHNKKPSMAVDVAPFERHALAVDWSDRERMTFFAGQVIATARSMGINLRWGGDWDRDTKVKDNTFDDLVHFELCGQ